MAYFVGMKEIKSKQVVMMCYCLLAGFCTWKNAASWEVYEFMKEKKTDFLDVDGYLCDGNCSVFIK